MNTDLFDELVVFIAYEIEKKNPIMREAIPVGATQMYRTRPLERHCPISCQCH